MPREHTPMRISSFQRSVLAIAALSLLSACASAGSNAPAALLPPAASSVQRAPAARMASGWMAKVANTNGLLYGSSYNGDFVNVYSLHGNNQQVIGTLTSGLVSPQGLFVDRQHTLWVANTNANTVVAFPKGQTAPSVTLSDPGEYPVTEAVGSDGTVYVANVVSTMGPPGNVTVYAKGSTNPTYTLSFSGIVFVSGVGLDSKNDLFVSIETSGQGSVVEFPAGSQKGQTLALSGVEFGGITFDRQDDLVIANNQGGLGIWAPPYNGSPTRSIHVFGNDPTFNHKENRIWIALANSQPEILGYNYTTGKLVDTITDGFNSNGWAYSVAIDPPAPL